MKNMVGIILAIISTGLLLISASGVKCQPLPADSFLKTRVETVNQLISQIQSSSVVQKRFSQVFKVPSSTLVSYIRKNVVESYVPATKTYRVWCVSRTGRLFQISSRLTAGTRVFALRNGTPIMKWACGNPLMSKLPATPAKPTVSGKTPGPPIATVTSTTEVIPTEVASVTPVETAAAGFAVPTSMVSGSSEIMGSVPTSSKGVIPWLPFAGGLAVLASSSGGSSASQISSLGSTSGGSSGSSSGSTGSISSGGTGGSISGGGSGSGGTTTTITSEPNPAETLVFGLLPLGVLMLSAGARRAKKSI